MDRCPSEVIRERRQFADSIMRLSAAQQSALDRIMANLLQRGDGMFVMVALFIYRHPLFIHFISVPLDSGPSAPATHDLVSERPASGIGRKRPFVDITDDANKAGDAYRQPSVHVSHNTPVGPSLADVERFQPLLRRLMDHSKAVAH